MKRCAFLLVTVFLLLSAVSVLAQDATAEATPEPTSEATLEATLEPTPETTAPVISEIGALFASLPQTRLADGAFVVGQPDAPITLIEFIDYACPHCQEYRPIIDEALMRYLAAGQVKYELRLLPTAGGQLSYVVDLAVECAEKQHPGAYWQAYDLLFNLAETGKYDENVGVRMSQALGLDYQALLDCLSTVKQVDTDIAFANEHGVGGTPAVMVRYGDGDPEFIKLDGTTYDRGGAPFDVIARAIEAANGIESTPEPEATSQVLMNLQVG